MKKSSKILIVVVVLVAVLGFQGCSTYNGLVSAEEELNNKWANVESQYQRRLDLIPNLVSTVKGYAAHESETLEALTKARAGLQDAYNSANGVDADNANGSDGSMKQFQQAQRQLQSALGIYVNAVHEAYPDLKANENFRDLMAQLEGTENRISTERTRYNEAVKEYNLKVRRFPASIFASMFGFEKKVGFEAEEGAEKAPKVEF